MAEINVQQRKFIVKAGMTADDVKNSKEATALQKKYASAFDTDGEKGFSQKEADLFNATTFAEKADGTVTFWTRQKDGTKKGTKFDSNDKNIQFKSEDDVKPYIKKVAVKKAEKQEQNVSFFDEKWSGHQIAKLTGDNAVTDWLQDKDKKCTDGKDDGKISFWEGTKSFAKGLIGGIPKAIVNHPLTTAAVVAGSTALIIGTGGAAAPFLVAAGAALGAVQVGAGAYNAATAETDAEAKMAWEGIGTGTATIGLSALAVKSSNQAAANGGVKSLQGLENESFAENVSAGIKALPEAFTQSGKNIKGNYLTWKTGVIHANSNATRNGVEVGFQSGNKVDDAYKVDLTGTVDEVLAKNPGLSYDAAKGQYYVETSWGEPRYISNDNYMYVKYGESVDPKTGKVVIDHNAVEGAEFYDTYIDHAKFEANGTKRYINPENLKPGQHVETSKNAPARFKVVPEGTKYLSAEGPGSVQPKSVLRIDGQGRPYESTVEFMLKKVQLTDAQKQQLRTVDPIAYAKHIGLNIVGKSYITDNGCHTGCQALIVEIDGKQVELLPEASTYGKSYTQWVNDIVSEQEASGMSMQEYIEASAVKAAKYQGDNVSPAKQAYVKPEVEQKSIAPKNDLCAGLLDYMTEEEIKDMQFRRDVLGEKISGADYWPGTSEGRGHKKWWEL